MWLFTHAIECASTAEGQRHWSLPPGHSPLVANSSGHTPAFLGEVSPSTRSAGARVPPSLRGPTAIPDEGIKRVDGDPTGRPDLARFELTGRYEPLHGRLTDGQCPGSFFHRQELPGNCRLTRYARVHFCKRFNIDAHYLKVGDNRRFAYERGPASVTGSTKK